MTFSFMFFFFCQMGLAFCLSWSIESWPKGSRQQLTLYHSFSHHHSIAGNSCQSLCFCDERPRLVWNDSILICFRFCLSSSLSATFSIILPPSFIRLGRPALFSRKRQDEFETGREAPAMASCLLFSSPLDFWCTSGYVQTAHLDASLSSDHLGEYI